MAVKSPLSGESPDPMAIAMESGKRDDGDRQAGEGIGFEIACRVAFAQERHELRREQLGKGRLVASHSTRCNRIHVFMFRGSSFWPDGRPVWLSVPQPTFTVELSILMCRT